MAILCKKIKDILSINYRYTLFIGSWTFTNYIEIIETSFLQIKSDAYEQQNASHQEVRICFFLKEFY